MSDIPSWAVRGSKVVSLFGPDDFNDPRNLDAVHVCTFPERDAVYTIREVRVRFVPEWGEVIVGILLHEIANPIATHGSATGEEMTFDVRGFRPLISKAAEQDIAEHFADLLKVDAPEGVAA